MENHHHNNYNNPPVSDQRVYFVTLRWWNDAHYSIPDVSAEGEPRKAVAAQAAVYVAAAAATSYIVPMKLINNIFSSDLAFHLRREEVVAERECVGVSGRDFEMVSGEMWVQAFKQHSDSKASLKENKYFSAAEDDMSDVYTWQLRLSIPKETNTPSVRICKKIYNNRISYLEEPTDSLTLIRDQDLLVAYQLARQTDSESLVVFMQKKMEEEHIHGSSNADRKAFGIPLAARVGVFDSGADIYSLFMKLLIPFLKSTTANLGDVHETKKDASPAEDTADTDTGKPTLNSLDVMEVESPSNSELQFYLTDEKGLYQKSKIEMNEPVALPENSHLYVAECWPESQIKECDMNMLCSLPEIFNTGISEKRAQEPVSLHKCLESLLTEEPLGPEDMWYCTGCKEHRQASKKLNIWRLPEIFVIHLKRFSYSRFKKSNLETLVDFPINDLDLSAYVSHTC